MSNREPFWWPMNEPPLPHGDLTPIQARYFEELEMGIPEGAAFRDIIDRTKHETRIRNGLNRSANRIETSPSGVGFVRRIDPAVDLQVDPSVTEHE